MKTTLILSILTTLLLATTAAFAAVPKQCNSQETCGSGKTCIENNCLKDSNSIKITLSWTSKADLDLLVVDPYGSTVSQGTISAGGGTLHRDACITVDTCVAVSDTHPHVEHVAWDSTKEIKGDYKVTVKNWSGVARADYTLIFVYPSGRKKIIRDTIKAAEIKKEYSFTITADLECDKDSDGDGLCDDWEINGIDVDGDDVVDLDLKKLGADPNHKDIFVEVDWIKGNKPLSLAAVKKAFKNAPVNNPDGKTGINLHIMMSDEITKINSIAIKEKRKIDINFLKEAAYDGKKDACGWFGSKADRKSPNCEFISKAREKVYRYVVFGYEDSINPGVLGRAPVPGRGFIMTPFRIAKYSTKKMVADTFLHELGHTLGLHHGGLDEVNCKPNYLSTMNYIYDAAAYPRSIDYSRHDTPTLDENRLIESVGMRGPASWTTVFFSGPKPDYFEETFSNADMTDVDWNADAFPDVKPVKANISRLSISSCAEDKTFEKLHSQNDWDSLIYNFRPSAGVRFKTNVETVEEPTVEDRLAFLDLIDTDKDGVSNRHDVCLVDSDPGQEDRDGDGVGDACDDCPDDAAPYEENGCPEQDLDENGNEFSSSDENSETSQLNSDDSAQQDSGKDVPELISAKTGGCNTTHNRPPIALFIILLFGLVATKRQTHQTPS